MGLEDLLFWSRLGIRLRGGFRATSAGWRGGFEEGDPEVELFIGCVYAIL